MDHDTLDRLRQTHPAWRILVADHAPLVLIFFVLAFIKPNRRAIPAPEVTAQLDAYLDQLRETSLAVAYEAGVRKWIQGDDSFISANPRFKILKDLDVRFFDEARSLPPKSLSQRRQRWSN